MNEDLYRWYYERLAEGYIKGLQRAMEHGEFKDLNPETVAYCLMGMASVYRHALGVLGRERGSRASVS